ncbi:MAG: hypothetical protein Q9218_003940 [Villophora microphyllina]
MSGFSASNVGRRRAPPQDVESNSTSGLPEQGVQYQSLPSQYDPLLDSRETFGVQVSGSSNVYLQGPTPSNAVQDPSESETDAETETEAPELEIPAAVRRADELMDRSINDNVLPSRRWNCQYTRFLRLLCDGTGTAAFEQDCLDGLPQVLYRVCSLDLTVSYKDDIPLKAFAYAVVIYVWLLVCKRRLQRTMPTKGEYMHLRWSAYSLSACDILTDFMGDVDQHLLDLALRHYEDRSFEVKKQGFWTRNHWLLNVVMEDPDRPCKVNDEAATYLDILRERGIEGLTEFLIHQEVQLQSSAMRELPDTVSFRWIIAMMASIDPDLLRAIIEGQVPRKAQIPNTAVSNRLGDMMRNRDPPPSVYLNAICDDEGFSPTPLQWRTVCRLLQLYVSESAEADDLAAEVDQVIYPLQRWPKPKHGRKRKLRRYTELVSTSDEDHAEPCRQRRLMVWNFSVEMLKIVDHEISQGRGHVPLVAPVKEIGISNSPIERLRDHRRHRRSNYIMNLTEATFRHQFDDHFGLKQYIIYNCWREDQSWASEILLTRLAQGYITNAGGFSHYGAGHSNGGPWRGRSAQDWARFQERVWSESGVRERLQGVHDRAVARLEEAKRQEKEEDMYIESLESLRKLVRAATDMAIAHRNI